MGNFLGSKHTLGFKKQTVAGTPETTVDTFLLTESMQMQADPKNIERKTYAGSGRVLPPRVGTISPKGKCKTEVAASQPHPWYWLLGTDTPSTVETGVYKHVITDGGAGVRLTVEGDRVFDKAKQADAYIDKLTLTAQPGEIAGLDIEWLALTHLDGQTLTSTPTFVTDPLTCRHAHVSIDGSPDTTVDSVEITVDSGSVQVPTLEDASGAPHVIRRAKPMAVTGKLKFIDYPTAMLAKLMAATSFALTVELIGDSIGALPSYKGLKVLLYACQVTGGLDPDISEDIITGEVEFTAYYSVSDSKQIQVEATNTIATL